MIRPYIGVERIGQSARVHATDTIRRNKPYRVAADASLMGNFEPRQMAVTRDIDGRASLERANTIRSIGGVGPRQGEQQRGIVGLRPPVVKCPAEFGEAEPLGHRLDDVRLDRYGRWGGGVGRQLRIEHRRDAIGALRWEGGRGIEQSKVARVVDMH